MRILFASLRDIQAFPPTRPTSQLSLGSFFVAA